MSTDDRFPERLALLVVAMEHERAGALLETLAEPTRGRALAAAGRFGRLSAADRE